MDRNYISMCRRSFELQGFILNEENPKNYYSFYGELQQRGIETGAKILVGTRTYEGYFEALGKAKKTLKPYLDYGCAYMAGVKSESESNEKRSVEYYEFPLWSDEDQLNNIYKWDINEDRERIGSLVRNQINIPIIWWIPGMQELREMLKLYITGDDLGDMFDVLNKFIHNFGDRFNLTKWTATQQVLLSYYHFIKHNKYWNGQLWVPIE